MPRADSDTKFYTIFVAYYLILKPPTLVVITINNSVPRARVIPFILTATILVLYTINNSPPARVFIIVFNTFKILDVTYLPYQVWRISLIEVI